MLEIFLLSITQGITEFLPISSSAHLILISKYLNFTGENLVIDISLHFGSLLAVLIFFKKEIINFFQNVSLFLKILIGSLPTILFGYLLLKLNLIEQLRNIYIISITTILFAVILYFSDRSLSNKTIENHFTLTDSIYIGFLQVFSLIPGVSRSGITITGARFLKFNRIDSAKISFLLSIPTLVAVSSHSLIKIIELRNIQITIENFWAVIFSFIFSIITLKVFVKFLKKFSLTLFVIYRFILGILILIYVFI
jgi:undecaprenyl-diphosphatase